MIVRSAMTLAVALLAAGVNVVQADDAAPAPLNPPAGYVVAATAKAKELFDYLIYYNNHRPHQALAGQTPKAFAETKTTAIQSAN